MMNHTKPLVLVADDVKKFCQHVSEELEEMGYRTITATTGPEAAEALLTSGRNVPELAIIALELPGLDGLAVIDELRAYDRTTAVILTTGYADPEVRREAEELDVALVLEHPIAPRKVATAAKRLLQRRALGRQNSERGRARRSA